MIRPHLDRTILTAALDAWEREPNAYDIAPFEAFAAAYTTEASYLWQLARGHAVPAKLVDAALANLLAWDLIIRDGTITALGHRLLDARYRR